MNGFAGKPYYDRHGVTVLAGDCLAVLATMAPASIDAIITDPPYEISFMSKKWDGQGIAYSVEMWAECLRVLRPGGHLAAFGGTRTYHRMACAVEDAGFEIRDSLQWIYGSGFPKSLDVSKAIDKAANSAPLWDAIRAHIREWRDRAGMTNVDLNRAVGSSASGCGMARHWTSESGGQHSIPSKDMWTLLRSRLGWPWSELDDAYDAVKDGAARPVIDSRVLPLRPGFAGETYGLPGSASRDITAPATDAARTWSGWGTSLKPAFEPIVLARKPLVGTVAQNVLAHGVGGLNIDATRVGNDTSRGDRYRGKAPGGEAVNGWRPVHDEPWQVTAGRWPANVLLSHGECTDDVCAPGCPVAELDTQSGTLTSGANPNRRGFDQFRDTYGEFKGQPECVPARGVDTGGASRFFPVFRWEAKAGTAERPQVAVLPKLRLRADLTDVQQAYVLAELTRAGVDVA